MNFAFKYDADGKRMQSFEDENWRPEADPQRLFEVFHVGRNGGLSGPANGSAGLPPDYRVSFLCEEGRFVALIVVDFSRFSTVVILESIAGSYHFKAAWQYRTV